MSADNYYVILPHPNGGFAAVMGFASDYDDEPLEADSGMHSFPTLSEAYDFASSEYTEYGVSIHPDCRKAMDKPAGIIFSEREKELIVVLCRTTQDSPIKFLFSEELESIIRKLES